MDVFLHSGGAPDATGTSDDAVQVWGGKALYHVIGEAFLAQTRSFNNTLSLPTSSHPFPLSCDVQVLAANGGGGAATASAEGAERKGDTLLGPRQKHWIPLQQLTPLPPATMRLRYVEGGPLKDIMRGTSNRGGGV